MVIDHLRLDGVGFGAQTNEAFQAIMDHMPVSVTLADPTRADCPLVYVNSEFCRTTGYAFDDVIGKNCRFLQGDGTDADAIERIRKAICAGEALEIELLNYRKSGEPFWNHLKLSPVYDAAGHIAGFVGIQRDISAERDTLRAALQRGKLEAVGRMAGALTHELNNLLQPTVNFTRFALDEMKTGAASEDKVISYLERGLGSARAAKKVVKDLEGYTLSLDRLERYAGNDVLYSLRVALKGAALMLPDTVRVIARISDGVFACAHNPEALGEVVQELLDNAAWAMRYSGNILCESYVDPEDTNHLVIDVIDEGQGIDPLNKSRVFDPFYTTKPAGQGSGLGLAVVYNKVRSWGGDICVDSEAGKGARFRVTLPRSTATAMNG